jgi:hypothetical protein
MTQGSPRGRGSEVAACGRRLEGAVVRPWLRRDHPEALGGQAVASAAPGARSAARSSGGQEAPAFLP